jgi:hypothetical protein
LLEAPKSSEIDAAPSARTSFTQIILGVVPAVLGLSFLLLGSSYVRASRFHVLLGLAGIAGLVWGAIPSPRWAAWAVLGLLTCGYASVILFIDPISLDDLATSPGVFVFISAFAVGPAAVGAYQAFKAIQRLRHTTTEQRSVA